VPTKPKIKRNFTKLKASATGAYSKYYYIRRKLGIKVLRHHAKLLTIAQLKKSLVWKAALMEAQDMRTARRRTHLSPKCYGIVPIKKGTKWYPGILVEHIDGIRLQDLKRKSLKKSEQKRWFPKSKIEKHLFNKLETVGIECLDFHNQNIIVSIKNKAITSIKIVDFSPDTIFFE
jgi:hypothetical protein